MNNEDKKPYRLILTQRKGIGEVWAVPEELLSQSSAESPSPNACEIPYLNFEDKICAQGFLLTPDELIRRGSARLEGILKDSDFPRVVPPEPVFVQEKIKAHLDFLRLWGFPGGVVGTNEIYPYLAAFLNDFLENYPECPVIVTGPRKALSTLEPFMQSSKDLLFQAPNSLEGAIFKDQISILFILEAERVVSYATPYFFTLLNLPKRLVLAQFLSRDFLRSYKREALSKVFGVSYYSVVWDFCLRDPKSPPLPDPHTYAWIADQESTINFAEYTLSDGPDLSPEPVPLPSAVNLPVREPSPDNWRLVYFPGHHSFFEDAQRLASYEEGSAEFIPFKRYYPTYYDMSPAQLKWYFYWRGEVRKGRYLETDLSYIFLHAYELVNNVGVRDPLESCTKLRNLWLNYRERFSRLDYYLVDWIADYIIVNNCPLDFLEIYKEALRLGFLRNPDLLIEEYLKGPLGEMPSLLLEELSFYKFTRSPFCRCPEGRELENLISKVLEGVNGVLLKEQRMGIFEKYRPPSRVKVERFPFQGAIYKDSFQEMILLGTVTPYSRYAPLSEFLGAVIKETENRLREKHKFPGRLGGYQLAPEIRKAVERTVKAERGAAAAVPITVDTRRVQDLLRESDEVKEMILRYSAPARDENFPESQKNDQAPGVSTTGHLRDKLARLPQDWREFASKLKAHQIEVLKALLLKENPVSQIIRISRESSLMPEALIDSLNEISLETIGDLIVDCSHSPPAIFEENLGKIRELIGIMENDELPENS